MKIILIVISIIFIGVGLMSFFGGDKSPKNAVSKKSIYDYSFTSIHGEKVSLSSFKGKKILIVNVASECGFTPQYEDLEKLYEKHKSKIVIIGFPANDFGAQEPGTNSEIATFCKTKFGVTFPLAEKSSVLGDKKNEIFRWLTEKAQNGWNDKSPKWNFYKYLINEKGELTNVFPSATSPNSDDIVNLIK